MPTSTNKGYELQVTGTNEDIWGDILNAQVIEKIDKNLGGSVTKSLTNLNVDLSDSEGQNLRLILNGTLTGNVLVRTPATGMAIVENNCTGAFTVTFAKHTGGTTVGTPIVLPNGTINLIAFGASGNPVSVGEEFPSGTRIVFQQTSAPTGWTKDVGSAGLANSALRFTTGTVTTGGSLDFTTAFASRGLSGTVNNHTLTEAQMPAHRHYMVNSDIVGNPALDGGNQLAVQSTNSSNTHNYSLCGSSTEATIGRTQSIGSNQSHNHGLSLNNLDIAVKYTDAIVAAKI